MKVIVVVAIACFLDGPDGTAKLIEALKSEDYLVRLDAAQKLNSLGEKARSAVPDVVLTYADEKDSFVYTQLKQFLKKNGRQSVEAITDYGLDKTKKDSKRILLLGLLFDQEYKKHATVINNRLAPLLRHPDKHLASRAAIVMVTMDAQNAEALDLLARLGKEENAATPVEDRLADGARIWEALAKSRHKAVALPHLIAELGYVRNDPESLTVREAYLAKETTYYLWLMGDTAKPATQEIGALFKKYEATAELRQDFGVFLACFLLHHDPSNDRLRAYIRDAMPGIKKHLFSRYSLMFISTLEMLGPQAKDAVGELQKIAHGENSEMSSAATRALRRIKGDE